MDELPRVKVCGLTRPDDVAVALAAGASALGFVHHPSSPRHVSLEDVVACVADVPAEVVTVLVVVDAEPEALGAAVRASGVHAVQLCGAEDPEAFRGFPAPILRRVPVDASGPAELARWAGVARGFVLDHPSGPGGTGRAVESDLAAELARAAPCLLAGGLDGATVGERVRAVRPAGVDGASRLETAPGIKDPEAVTAFVRGALAAFEELTEIR